MSSGREPSNQRWASVLKPLGGKYQGQYWALAEEEILEVEKIVGWALPDDYREYLAATGLAGCVGGVIRPTLDESTWIGFDVLYGAPPPPSEYSVLAFAGEFLEPEPVLLFATSDAGGAFYMNQHHQILYEYVRGPTVVVAQSFAEFMDSIELYAD